MGSEHEIHSLSEMTAVAPPDSMAGFRAGADLLKDLGLALARHQLVLYFQPIVDARTLAITGVRTLVRWHHPQWGTIPSEEFVPLAKKHGLMTSIGAWVMKEAICQMKLWALQYGCNFRFSMVLSARLLDCDHPEKIATLEQSLLQHGLQGNNLMIEITGYSLQHNAASTEDVLAACRAIGVRVSVALDGYGAVYPLLSCLESSAVDALKIDRSLVQPLMAHSRAHHRCSDILQIARKMDLAVIADGIETGGQAKLLEELGCDSLQGDLFGRPLPAEGFGFSLGPCEQEGRSLA